MLYIVDTFSESHFAIPAERDAELSATICELVSNSIKQLGDTFCNVSSFRYFDVYFYTSKSYITLHYNRHAVSA